MQTFILRYCAIQEYIPLSAASGLGSGGYMYLWNDAAFAPRNFSYDVSFPYSHQGQVHYPGSAANPFESQFATITWDMRTVIDTTNPPIAYCLRQLQSHMLSVAPDQGERAGHLLVHPAAKWLRLHS